MPQSSPRLEARGGLKSRVIAVDRHPVLLLVVVGMNVHSKCHATRDSAHARGARVGLCGLSLLLGLGLGCGGSDDKPGGEVSQPDAEAAPVADAGGDAGAPSGPQLAVSADFLNQTLSIFDVNALAEGKT